LGAEGLKKASGYTPKTASTGKVHGIDIVLGSQWGDEGKGKLVDILSQVSHANRMFGFNRVPFYSQHFVHFFYRHMTFVHVLLEDQMQVTLLWWKEKNTNFICFPLEFLTRR